MIRRSLRRSVLLLALVVILPGPSACTDQVELGVELGTANGNAACEVTKCLRSIYLCGDSHDNDGDGLCDGNDPDCLGACDNTEDSYYGGIPGQNNAPCVQDCYFDQDTGSGNDDCYWSHECDGLSRLPDFPPSGDERCAYNPGLFTTPTGAGCVQLMQQQSAACRNYCMPLTPNGCDCFGCCLLGGKYVWLGSTENNVGSCSRDTVSDPAACHPCTPVASCLNGCADCEICVGRELPAASCNPPDAGFSGQCPTDVQPCGLKGQEPCPSGKFCITGCCIDVPK